jgi:hypothetical protein
MNEIKKWTWVDEFIQALNSYNKMNHMHTNWNISEFIKSVNSCKHQYTKEEFPLIDPFDFVLVAF